MAYWRILDPEVLLLLLHLGQIWRVQATMRLVVEAPIISIP
jgi:hypothetical protein